MAITKHKLIFDTTDASGSDNVGSYLIASDGTLLTHTTIGPIQALDVNVGNTVTVSATDFDIRDLSHTQDSVKIGDGVDFLAINADGSINATVTTDFSHAEDSLHVSGDFGVFSLSVRQDTLSASAGNGDYQSFKTDSLGQQYVNDATQTMAHSAVTVSSTATDLVATDLTNRKRIIIQNNGSKEIFVGSSTVTTATGISIPTGANVELDAGPLVNLYAITVSGTSNVRILELA